jgi:hypothetical protein
MKPPFSTINVCNKKNLKSAIFKAAYTIKRDQNSFSSFSSLLFSFLLPFSFFYQKAKYNNFPEKSHFQEILIIHNPELTFPKRANGLLYLEFFEISFYFLPHILSFL